MKQTMKRQGKSVGQPKAKQASQTAMKAKQNMTGASKAVMKGARQRMGKK